MAANPQVNSTSQTPSPKVVIPATFRPQLRALSAIRLSVLTDETTSPARQREANEQAAAHIGAEIIGEAEDLDVSASKTTPWERPELGKWLNDRADEYDVIIWWRFDRAIRSQGDMHELAKWATAHRKMIVFAHGVGGGVQSFDFRDPMNPMTTMMLNQFAFAAEMEAWSIRERVNGAQAAMRNMQLRWRGGRPPYGYIPKELPGGGHTLVQDPDAVRVIERIIRDLLAGKTISAIAADLNEEGVPSPRDRWAKIKGRKTGGKTGATKGKSVTRERFDWRPAMLARMMRSYALIGWKVHDGNPVRDANGEPIMSTAEPILTRAEFDRIGALLDSRKTKMPKRKDSSALLLGVIFCASCGGRAYLDTPKLAYKCGFSSRGHRCERPVNVRREWADKRVTDAFLDAVGGLYVTEVTEIPGYDPTPEIAATLAEYEEHQAQEGRQRSKAARDAWQRRADALDARLAELESREKTEPRREIVSTGRTYADTWEAADVAARREMLQEAGARLMVNRLDAKKPHHRSRFELTDEWFAEAAEWAEHTASDAL
ncbi:recombinase family protein [Streptomyces sp. NPDC044984]|uniref:recombinase family protein n=1 Tax=Streptomyces sp. NPDC044984 TaxID=3154335 RepID=UPI00340D2B11